MIDNVTTENMSNEEVIEVLKGIVFNGFNKTTRKERQALDIAIKTLKERPQGEQIAWEQGYEFGKNEKRPQGEWVKTQGEWVTDTVYKIGFKCSECDDHFGYPFNFCPNCGADMR